MSKYLSATLITGLIYFAVYFGESAPISERLLDALLMVMAFTIPLSQISNWNDISKRSYQLLFFLALGTWLFSALQPIYDHKYDPAVDGFWGLFPSVVIFFITLCPIQVLAVKWLDPKK